MQQQYHENIVNNTDDNDPVQKQQNKHRSTSTVNHVAKELSDTDALKKKFRTYYLLEHICQYYTER